MPDEEDFVGRLGKMFDAQLGREVRRWRENRPKAQPPAVVEESTTVLGAWGSMTASVAVFAAASSGVPGAAEGAKVIQALVGIEDSQEVMLRRIRHDVQLLREGPFNTAQEQLRIALRKGPAHADYADHLRAAESSFITALGQASSTEEKSIIRFNLGVVEAARGDVAEALYRLKESFADCVNVTRELCSRAGNVKVLKSRWTTAVTAMYFPYVIGARKLLKMQKAQDAAIALEAYVPFVNTVARTANEIERTAVNPGLILHRSSGQDYELEWTEPSVSFQWPKPR